MGWCNNTYYVLWQIIMIGLDNQGFATIPLARIYSPFKRFTVVHYFRSISYFDRLNNHYAHFNIRSAQKLAQRQMTGCLPFTIQDNTAYTLTYKVSKYLTVDEHIIQLVYHCNYVWQSPKISSNKTHGWLKSVRQYKKFECFLLEQMSNVST